MATLPPQSTLPRDLLLDDTNDIVFTNGALSWTSGIQAVVQSCRIALQMFAGEWFLDLDAGIPYWQQILGQKPNTALAAAQVAFGSALSEVDGVVQVVSLNVTYDGPSRTMSVTWQVLSNTGLTPPDTLALSLAGVAS